MPHQVWFYQQFKDFFSKELQWIVGCGSGIQFNHHFPPIPNIDKRKPQFLCILDYQGSLSLSLSLSLSPLTMVSISSSLFSSQVAQPRLLNSIISRATLWQRQITAISLVLVNFPCMKMPVICLIDRLLNLLIPLKYLQKFSIVNLIY